MSWFFISQLLCCLLVGGLTARYFSEYIRSLVVRFMPLEQRISEESFHIQARASTIIAAVLSLLLAGILFWGLEQTKAAIGFSPLFQQSPQATILPLTPERAIPTNNEQQEVTAEAPPALAIEQAVPIPSPSQQDTLPKVVMVYYLQLGAYNEIVNARAEVERLRKQHKKQVQLIVLPSSTGPHKVLLGPFSSRRAAADYRHAYEMTGFVRKHVR